MKYFLVLILFVCSTAFAEIETQKYAVENPDGTLKIIYYLSGSTKPISKILKDIGRENSKIAEINPLDYSLLKEDPKYLKFSGDRIVVDEAKKEADLATEASLVQAKTDLLKKLGITEQEAEILTK